MLVLQLADQSKAVPVDLAVPRPPPGPIGGREQALLDVEIDRPWGDAGVVAEGLEVQLSHSINITVTSDTVNIFCRQSGVFGLKTMPMCTIVAYLSNFFVAKTCCVDVADSRRRGGQSLQVLEHPLAVGGLARVEDEGAGAG